MGFTLKIKLKSQCDYESMNSSINHAENLLLNAICKCHWILGKFIENIYLLNLFLNYDRVQKGTN